MGFTESCLKFKTNLGDGATTFSIITLSITTLSITIKKRDIKHNDTKHNGIQYCFAECRSLC